MWRRPVPIAAAAAVVAVLVTGLVGWSLWPAAEPQLVNQFAYPVPDDQTFTGTGRSVMALAPDGRSFVYNTSGGLYLRTMGELEARLIPGTEGALVLPFFSPDGQSVGYWQAGELKRIAISGGAPVVITEGADNLNGAIWGADGTILFGQTDGIYRVPATGGTPALVIAVEDGERLDGAQLLPGGDTVLFSVMAGTSWDDAQVVAQSLSSGERTIVLEGGSDARYLPTGHLVYALGDGLFGMAFDADSLSVTGGAVPLAQGLMRANGTAGANYGVSDDGTLVYVSGGGAAAERSLVWVDRNGREEPLAAPPRNYIYPRLSPDGTRVALDVRDQELDIWIWDLARETSTRLTFDAGQDQYPVWTPDSTRVLFSSTRDGPSNVYWKAADGTGTVERLTESANSQWSYSLSPDGQSLVLREQQPGTAFDLRVVSLAGDRAVETLLATEFIELNGELSPNGRWIAYQSNQSGQQEVYVRPFPNVDDGQWQISTSGGTESLWASSGRELFYRRGAELMTVPVEAESSFTPGTPEVVFNGPYRLGLGRAYDVSADGQRFLMITEGGDAEGASAPPQIIVVQNWFEELRRLVPTD